jgi:hypothetical protein
VKRLRARLTYANVMATLAMFLVLGGATAWAALGKNTVGTKQLKNNAVTVKKIKNNAVTTAKIKNNAVTTAKIKDGAVTGAKVNLGSLGKVPSAASADTATSAGNANTVGGRTVTQVFVKIQKSTAVTVGTFGPFKIVATCNAAGDFENFELDPQTSDTDIAAFGNGVGVGPIFEREQGAEPNSIDLTGGNVRGITTFSAAQSGGFVVTGTLGYDDTATFNGEPVCAIYGQVIS